MNGSQLLAENEIQLNIYKNRFSIFIDIDNTFIFCETFEFVYEIRKGRFEKRASASISSPILDWSCTGDLEFEVRASIKRKARSWRGLLSFQSQLHWESKKTSNWKTCSQSEKSIYLQNQTCEEQQTGNSTVLKRRLLNIKFKNDITVVCFPVEVIASSGTK